MDPSAMAVLSTDSNSVRVVNIWAADGRFVIDRSSDSIGPIRGRCSRPDRHDEGGLSALLRRRSGAGDVARCASRGGINMDGYLAGTAWVNGLDRPFLQLRSDPIDIDGLRDQLKTAGTTRRSCVSCSRIGMRGRSRSRGAGGWRCTPRHVAPQLQRYDDVVTGADADWKAGGLIAP
jgi:hypothetical protein